MIPLYLPVDYEKIELFANNRSTGTYLSPGNIIHPVSASIINNGLIGHFPTDGYIHSVVLGFIYLYLYRCSVFHRVAFRQI